MLKVFKIGGNVIDDVNKLDRFLDGFTKIDGPKILVHGGGKIATRLAADLGIESKMIDGRRITDKDTLDITVMTYAGLINKTIVSILSAKCSKAVGLCGADANMIVSVRRSPHPIDYGYVGDPVLSDFSILSILLEQNLTPVIAPVTTDGKGQLLNTNADTVARTIALAAAEYQPTELIYCFEKKGVLFDPDNDCSVISDITPQSFEHLRKEGVISGGMIPKIENSLDAVHGGVSSVVICSSEDIADYGTSGTRISL